MTKKITAAMSGGVDSSAVALILLNEGHKVSGATMHLRASAGAESDIRDAAAICAHLGIPHAVYELSDEFERCVIQNFIDVYENGGTPNPCIICNRDLKFGVLLELALQNGADAIATGHYARITCDTNGRYLLMRATDTSKDQSYVLWMLSQHQLAHTVFPLGDRKKSEIRELADAKGLITAHKSDSQDICFIPDGKYAEFIERYSNKVYPVGNFTDTEGNILGKHRGIIHYTVGQRKGLGISFGQPMFVKSKDADTGNIVLCGNDELFTKEIDISNINLIATDKINESIRAEVKIRYAHAASSASVIPTGEDSLKIVFDEPQRAPAPGQSAVMYDGDVVIGGGVIK